MFEFIFFPEAFKILLVLAIWILIFVSARWSDDIKISIGEESRRCCSINWRQGGRVFTVILCLLFYLEVLATFAAFACAWLLFCTAAELERYFYFFLAFNHFLFFIAILVITWRICRNTWLFGKVILYFFAAFIDFGWIFCCFISCIFIGIIRYNFLFFSFILSSFGHLLSLRRAASLSKLMISVSKQASVAIFTNAFLPKILAHFIFHSHNGRCCSRRSIRNCIWSFWWGNWSCILLVIVRIAIRAEIKWLNNRLGRIGAFIIVILFFILGGGPWEGSCWLDGLCRLTRWLLYHIFLLVLLILIVPLCAFTLTGIIIRWTKIFISFLKSVSQRFPWLPRVRVAIFAKALLTCFPWLLSIFLPTTSIILWSWITWVAIRILLICIWLLILPRIILRRKILMLRICFIILVVIWILLLAELLLLIVGIVLLLLASNHIILTLRTDSLTGWIERIGIQNQMINLVQSRGGLTWVDRRGTLLIGMHLMLWFIGRIVRWLVRGEIVVASRCSRLIMFFSAISAKRALRIFWRMCFVIKPVVHFRATLW